MIYQNHQNLSISFFIKLFGWSRRVTPCVTSFMCFPRAIVEVNVAKNKKSAPANIVHYRSWSSAIICHAHSNFVTSKECKEGEKVAKKRYGTLIVNRCQ